MERPVLVVDDDTDVCEMITSVLESELGLATVQAHSGEEAMLKAIEWRPALVLLDMRMPDGIGGLETVRALKSDATTQSIPIIGMSGSVPEVMGLLAGCDDFIAKPFDIGQFALTVQHHMQAKLAS